MQAKHTLLLLLGVAAGMQLAVAAPDAPLGTEELKGLFQQWRREEKPKKFWNRVRQFFKAHGREMAVGSIAALGTAVAMKKRQTRALRRYQQEQRAEFSKALQERDKGWEEKIKSMENQLASYLRDASESAAASNEKQLTAITTSLNSHSAHQQALLQDGLETLRGQGREFLVHFFDENRRVLDGYRRDREAMQKAADEQSQKLIDVFARDRAQLEANYGQQLAALEGKQVALMAQATHAAAAALEQQREELGGVLAQVKSLTDAERAARTHHFEELAQSTQDVIRHELASRFEESKMSLDRQYSTQLAQLQQMQAQAQQTQQQLVAQAQAVAAAASRKVEAPAPKREPRQLTVESAARVSISPAAHAVMVKGAAPALGSRESLAIVPYRPGVSPQQSRPALGA